MYQYPMTLEELDELLIKYKEMLEFFEKVSREYDEILHGYIQKV